MKRKKEEKERKEQPDKPVHNKQGTFGQYTNYGCTSHKTSIDESSTDTHITVNTNGMETDDLSKHSRRDVRTNTNNAIEVKLPNEIKALSGRKFTGDELTTYRDEIGERKKECYEFQVSTPTISN